MKHTFRARIGLVLVGIAIASGFARAEIIEQVLVKVNGEPFTKTDLETRQVALLREQGQRNDPKASLPSAELRKQIDEVTPQIMVDAIDEMLVVQRGKELGYKLSDEQFKSFVDNLRKENKLEQEEQFQAALKQEGLTLVDLRRNVERRMIWQRVQQNEVVGKVAMSDEETRAYYDSHIKEFTSVPSVTLREILIAVASDSKGVNVAADDAAKERAEEIRARAVAGESFEKLAADLSTAPSRKNAGLVGPLTLSDLSTDLRAMVETMKVGEITKPLRTARGYQILKLESITAVEVQPFEQVREQISGRVLTDKRRQEFEKYLVKLRGQAIIDWKNDDVKRAYLEGLKKGALPGATAPSAPSH